MVLSRNSVHAHSMFVFLSVIMMYGGSVLCEGQCEARREFGPYHPAERVTPTLANPLGTPRRKTALKIVTIGDSVVWGNGNLPENKFSIKVAQHMADATGRDVLVIAYAHSGARLKVYNDDSLVPVVDGESQQDLNSQRPTTTEQVVVLPVRIKTQRLYCLTAVLMRLAPRTSRCHFR